MKRHQLLLTALLASSLIASAQPAPSPLDYTYGYWSGTWRRDSGSTDLPRLCIESGYYGFQWDIKNPSKIRFGLLDDKVGYLQAGGMALERLQNLPEGELEAEIKIDGRTYKMKACRAGLETKNSTPLSYVWLWESARIAQNYELRELQLEDAEGNILPAIGSLAVVAWPQSLSFSLDLQPLFNYQDGLAPGRKGSAYSVRTQPLEVSDAPGIDSPAFTAECWFLRDERKKSETGTIFGKNHNENRDGHFGVMLGRWGKLSAVMSIYTDGTNNIHLISESAPDLDVTGKWHHVVLTYDGSTMRVYANGRLLGQKEINLPRKPGNGVLRFGQRPDGAFPIQAVFDDVRMWNRALSEQEIAAIFKNPDTLPSQDGLVYQANFDEPPVITHPVWKDAELALRFKAGGLEKSAERKISGDWTYPRSENLTLNCNLPGSPKPDEGVSIKVSTGGNQTVPTAFEPRYDCIVARANYSFKVTSPSLLKRAASRGGPAFYDEFLVEVENQGTQPRNVPFLLEMLGTASITGLVPMLCELDGTPTGIPVQLSKNWHHTVLPNYLRAYTLLPAAPGKTSYLLRVVYGFYGSLPSASNSQLSLVGWGDTTNGRWDQLAIGSSGETICFNPEFSASISAITDVRALLTRQGKDGKKWQWSDAGWGGDWLSVNGPTGSKLMLARTKTSYLSHGPCLPETVYQGSYGANGEVELKAEVSTPRTDDHAKTFIRLRYDFRTELPTKDSWLFRLGQGKVFCPKIAIGNRDGLIQELDAPKGLKTTELALDHYALTGPAPWWVGFPGSKVPDWATGSKGFVVRSYRANFGGKTYDSPTLSLPVGEVGAESRCHVDAVLVPPAGIEKYQAGDSVEMDIEIDVIPAEVDDYYGPNEAFRKHIAENPGSWKTFHRLAIANDLQVEAQGASVLRNFPIVVKADPGASMIRLEIQGGAGAVPVRFEGLDSAKGWELGQVTSGEQILSEYLPLMAKFAPSLATRLSPETQPLDQSDYGNDFWETSFDPDSKTYTVTYNLPLDGKSNTTWILKKLQQPK